MKKVNIIYWTSTIIFGGLMLFSAIPNVVSSAESVELIGKYLGYPAYMIPFIGVAKVLGVIAILVPGFPRIKEWAYSGLAFDLLGATYSAIAVGGFVPEMLGMLMFFVPGVVSYIYYHKRLTMKEAGVSELRKAPVYS
jgi:hypothetical protein